MSTKYTLAHSEDFHFYREIFEERHVYLELRGAEFTAMRDRVTVAIPLPVWELIRTLGGAYLPLANESDAALRALVETQVDEEIARRRARKADPAQRLPVPLRVERPREEQIAEALEELRQERDVQREMRDAIRALEEKNRPLLPGQQP